MDTRKLTLSGLLVAMGVLLGHIIYIPIGVSKCFPIQHAINVIAAVSLGPAIGTAIAFSISLMRNILGTGSLLAFPGSMVGVFIAAMLYKRTRKLSLAALGEIIGTGLIGGVLAFPIAKFLMGSEAGAFFFVGPFLISTLGGSFIGLLVVKAMENLHILEENF